MVWISEGYILDDANSLIQTTYIDLRGEANRTLIPALVKGCRREHALEDAETVLISQPERFQQYGEDLIQDIQEGLAKTESVTLKASTVADVRRRKAVDDLNEACEPRRLPDKHGEHGKPQ